MRTRRGRRRADRPGPDSDRQPLRRRRRRHRGHAGRFPHPRGHRHGRRHGRQIPDHGLSRPFLFLGKQSNYTPGSGDAVTTPRDWKLLRGAVTTWERDWELLTGWKRWLVVGRRGARFLHRLWAAGRSGRHRHRARPVRNPVPGHHSRLRPGLLRPAPARQAASPAGPAVTTLPRGHVLLPVGKTCTGWRPGPWQGPQPQPRRS